MPSGGKMSRAMRWRANPAPSTTAMTSTTTVSGRRMAGWTRFIRFKDNAVRRVGYKRIPRGAPVQGCSKGRRKISLRPLRIRVKIDDGLRRNLRDLRAEVGLFGGFVTGVAAFDRLPISASELFDILAFD